MAAWKQSTSLGFKANDSHLLEANEDASAVQDNVDSREINFHSFLATSLGLGIRWHKTSCLQR